MSLRARLGMFVLTRQEQRTIAEAKAADAKSDGKAEKGGDKGSKGGKK